MVDVDKLKEEELKELSDESNDLFELETLITEGVDSRILFEFTYPNTDKKVGVLLRPLTTQEYVGAVNAGKAHNKNFLIEVLKLSLYTLNGDEFPVEKLNKLPAGVVTRLVEETSRISGVDLAADTEINNSKLMNDLMGF